MGLCYSMEEGGVEGCGCCHCTKGLAALADACGDWSGSCASFYAMAKWLLDTRHSSGDFPASRRKSITSRVE